jgi:ArsR family transcriptional regulator
MSSTALDVGSFSRLFRALGEETRLRIVALLSHGELCVCHLEQALGLSQPNVSRHLGILHAAGVVGRRREGSWVYYRLARQDDPECERQLKTLMGAFVKRPVLRKDVERLVLKGRGPASCR